MPSPRAPENEPRADDRRRFVRGLFLLLVAAAGLRLAYVAQSTALPFFDAPLYDSEVYLHQARQIRAGNFNDASLVAFSPLYGWLLAALGARVPVVVAVQLLLGLSTLWLLVSLAYERVGAGGALLAGVVWVGYGLPMFYETKVLSETLGLALAVAGLALFVRSARGSRWTALCMAVGAGVVLGLSALARASLVFTLPIYPLVALAFGPAPPSWCSAPAPPATTAPPVRRAAHAAFVALGLAAVLIGNGLWNRVHVGLFVPVILVSRTAAVASQHEWTGDFRIFAAPDGAGDVSPWDVVRQAQGRIAEARRGEAPARSGQGPWGIDLRGWLRRLPAKLLRTASDRETSFDYGYYGERSEVGVLRALPVSFALLEVLAAVGVGLLWARHGAGALRGLLPLLPLLLGTLATTTLFYPTSRYRLPLAPVLVLLAAHCGPGLAALGVRARRLMLAVLSLLALALCLRTITRGLEQPADWHLRVAEAAARAGDVDEARRRIAQARQLAPGDPAIEHRIQGIAGPARNW